MEITVRKYCKYRDVKVKLDNATIDLGFHDDSDRKALAQQLKTAIGDLLEPDEVKELMAEEFKEWKEHE